jgi:hypothetical protein
MSILDTIFSRYKWYRRMVGGEWKKIRVRIPAGYNYLVFWSRISNISSNDEILETESY